jgi:hypothetical protein
MKTHATFATSLIAKKCFSAKMTSNEYHFGAEGAPVTMKELSEKVSKIATIDHFKKTAKNMLERMKGALKTEYEDEINKMAKEVEKMAADVVKKGAAKKPAAKNNGNKKKKIENLEVDEEEEPLKSPASKKQKTEDKAKPEKQKAEKAKPEKQKSEEKAKPEKQKAEEKAKPEKQKAEEKAKPEKQKAEEKAKPEKQKVERAKPARGKTNKQNEKIENVEKEEKEKENPQKEKENPQKEKEPIKAIKTEAKAPEVSERKCEMCKAELAPPMYQCVDLHIVCHVCLHGSERGYCPICKKQSGKNRRPKKHDKWETIRVASADSDVKIEEETTVETATEEKKQEAEPIKMDVEEKAAAPPVPALALAPAPETAVPETQAKTRKRRGKNQDPAEGETKQKTKKTAAATAPKAPKRMTKAEKKLLEAKAKAETETKIDENAHPPKLETLFAAGAPTNLPKSVLLPTAPIVQNLLPKSPQPQVAAVQAFQLRPTTGNLQILGGPPGAVAPGSPPQFRMQSGSPSHPSSTRPQGLQFFKIVEGKPVQISGSIVGGDVTTSTIQPRLPTSPLPIQPNAAAGVGPKLLYVRNPISTSTAPGSSMSPTRPQLAQKQIILLSKKAPGNAHILTPVSPTNSQGIVKLVSTGGNGDGGKMILGSNVARVAPQLQGPVLLRPVGSLPSPPLPPPQLPSVPLPRAALNSAPVIDKAQALLPKSPLPPAQIKNATALKMSDGPPSLPASTAPSTATTTSSSSSKSDSVVNKAFVWKNSDKTQFKLSARFNFDLFREYQKAHPNKDIRFALASIVTEDKSNEFSFHLSQQKEEGEESFWQLGVRAKNVSEHVWHLKVKVEPPVFLVNNGTFKQTMANFRIPKDVSDKAVVDYELLLMGKASAVATAVSGSQGVAAKTGRASKKAALAQQQQLQQKQQQ